MFCFLNYPNIPILRRRLHTTEQTLEEGENYFSMYSQFNHQKQQHTWRDMMNERETQIPTCPACCLPCRPQRQTQSHENAPRHRAKDQNNNTTQQHPISAPTTSSSSLSINSICTSSKLGNSHALPSPPSPGSGSQPGGASPGPALAKRLPRHLLLARSYSNNSASSSPGAYP